MIVKNPNSYGIPQGSPISALLANVYMLDIDKKIYEIVTGHNGMYMRYSDDFIIILPDIEKTKALTELAHSYGKEAVFHKAFDCIEDQEEALKELIAVGVDRVLTSGGGKAALDKADHLAYLIKTYGHQITLLLGGGIREGNVENLIRATGASQIHTACAGFLEDPTVMGNGVSYAYRPDGNPQAYEAVDPDQVAGIRKVLDRM